MVKANDAVSNSAQMFKHLTRKIKLKNVTRSFDDSNIIIKSGNFLVFNFKLLKELK